MSKPAGKSLFVTKLYDLVADAARANVLEWSAAGDKFKITDWSAFQNALFPRHFRCKWTSFLNYLFRYGFRKVGECYWHRFFTRDSPQLDKIEKRPRKQKPVAAPLICLPKGDPVIGYTLDGTYHPLQDGAVPCFYRDGNYILALSSNLERHAHCAIPCVVVARKPTLLRNAVFETVEPQRKSAATYKVRGYLLQGDWVMLPPGDSVVYWDEKKRKLCPVLKQTDLKMAQSKATKTFVEHQGEHIPLAPGTPLLFQKEAQPFEPTEIPLL